MPAIPECRIDPVMVRARRLVAASGLSLAELGRRMGAESDAPSAAAWMFLYGTANPTVRTLRRFAAAVGVEVADLFREGGDSWKR
jgi:transcriptional regulator with XRE-family HTH domain